MNILHLVSKQLGYDSAKTSVSAQASDKYIAISFLSFRNMIRKNPAGNSCEAIKSDIIKILFLERKISYPAKLYHLVQK